MAGFSNPIIGGDGALVYPSVHSPDYSPGTAGWTVNKDGSAEFNNLTVRGTFHGLDFEINSSGIFVYSGTPALGNLIGSWAGAAGADRFGNAYQKDLGVYAAVNTGYASLSSTGGIGGNTALLFHPGSTSHVTEQPQLFGGSNQSGLADEEEYLALTSGTAAGNDDAQLQLISGSADATIPAVLNFLMGGTVLSQLFKTAWNIDVPVSATAGTVSSPTLITTDSWNLITMDSGWSTLAGQTPPQYRLLEDNTVDMIGGAQYSSSFTAQNIASGSNVLPAAYRPAGQQYIGGTGNAAGLQVSSNGNLQAVTFSFSTVYCNFNGRIRLGI